VRRQGMWMGSKRLAAEVLARIVWRGSVSPEDAAFLSDPARRRELYRVALANRILLHVMELVKGSGVALTREEEAMLGYLMDKYRRSLLALRASSSALRDEGVSAAVIKTVRPYKATTVDVDILVLGGRGELRRAVGALARRGFRVYAVGPESVTMEKPGLGVNVDLYFEVAASRLVYCPREPLREYLAEANVEGPDGAPFGVPVLEAGAEFLVVAGHSIVKEQMFTLADYLMLSSALAKAGSAEVRRAAEELKCRYALEYASRMMPLVARGGVFPVKVGPGLVAYYLARLAYEAEYFRRSIVWQISYLASPRKSREFIGYLVEHALRATY